MTGKKIIAVMGATGAQGGGLARAILADKSSEFTLRALTRDKNSEKSFALREFGAEVVEVNIDDPESISRAFNGAYGAYCVTFFWDHFSPEKEIQNVKDMAQAAKDTKLQHVVWSTLEDTRKHIPLTDDRMPTLMGNYKVPHFDAKGEANKYFTQLGVPTTMLYTSFYWDNFITFGMGPKKDENGNLVLALPMGDKPLPGIAAEDIGKCAYGIFKKGGALINESIGIAGEHLTGSQMAETFSIALKTDVNYYPIEPSVYRTFGFPGAEDLGNMFQYKQEFNEEFCRIRKTVLSKSLNPNLQTFDEWLTKNIERIPLD